MYRLAKPEVKKFVIIFTNYGRTSRRTAERSHSSSRHAGLQRRENGTLVRRRRSAVSIGASEWQPFLPIASPGHALPSAEADIPTLPNRQFIA